MAAVESLVDVAPMGNTEQSYPTKLDSTNSDGVVEQVVVAAADEVVMVEATTVTKESQNKGQPIVDSTTSTIEAETATTATTTPEIPTMESPQPTDMEVLESVPAQDNNDPSKQSRNQNAPFHNLMLPVSEQPKQQTTINPVDLLVDRTLRRDYLSRRYRAFAALNHHHDHHYSQSKTDAVPTPLPTSFTINFSETPLWCGASSLERALVECCELPPVLLPSSEDEAAAEGGGRRRRNNNNVGGNDPFSTYSSTVTVEQDLGGSLAKGFEVKFVGLLCKYCHSFGSRVLALAILERSLQQDKKDALEPPPSQPAVDDDDDGKDKIDVGSETSEDISDNDLGDQEDSEQEATASEEEDDDDDDDDDDEYDPNEKVIVGKRGRPRKQGRGRPRKRVNSSLLQNEPERTPSRRATRTRTATSKKTETAVNVEAKPTNAKTTSKPIMKKKKKEESTLKEDNSIGSDDENNQPDRLTAFFLAGGLKLLRSWLVDAMAKVPVSSSKEKEEPSDNDRVTAAYEKFKPSEYGPMLLPLLELLSEIPFDKGLIMESKINKQIRKLSKQVDGLVQAFQRQHQGKDAAALLETFVDPGGSIGGCVVIRVQKVLNTLKETWENHVKELSEQREAKNVALVDPYESIKKQLREKLGVLKNLEAGKIETPHWVVKCEEMSLERQKKRPRRTQVVARSRPVPPAAAAAATTSKKEGKDVLAPKQREAERIALQDKLKAAQEERKAHLELLKNLNKKRISESQVQASSQISNKAAAAAAAPLVTATTTAATAAVKRKVNGKSVRWKDGLSDDKIRNREILEIVYVIKTENSNSKSSGADGDEKAHKKKKEPEEPEGAALKRHSGEDYGLSEMFDCDETLLL